MIDRKDLIVGHVYVVSVVPGASAFVPKGAPRRMVAAYMIPQAGERFAYFAVAGGPNIPAFSDGIAGAECEIDLTCEGSILLHYRRGETMHRKGPAVAA